MNNNNKKNTVEKTHSCTECGEELVPGEIWYSVAGDVVCWHCHEDLADALNDMWKGKADEQ